MSDEQEKAEVDCLMRIPQTKNSRNGCRYLAIARDGDDLKNEPILLPFQHIKVRETGRFEAGMPIIVVTMAQSLAERKGLC
jgi:hypothetical protein